jgi:drug/metabolite transporter (DMT)-like permease
VALLLGFLGVLGFSFSLPATRLAVEEIDPVFVGVGRAAVAAGLAALCLLALGQPRPTREQLPRLAIVGVGVVLGFPLLTALALTELDSSHGAVIIALLPAATAIWAVSRAGERPSRAFWIASAAALVAVLAFSASRGQGLPQGGDWMLLGGVVLCALGYAEGGALGRDLGGWQTICWALIVSLPVTLPVTVVAGLTGDLHGSGDAWLGFAYVCVVSMFLGFFAWYGGLARGGVAKIGQVQHAQPVLTLVWAALLLGEEVTPGTVLAALAVLACVAITQRTRVARALPVAAAQVDSRAC